MTVDGEPVHLYVYDLSGGLAATLSQSLLGQQINGVWHTSIVVGGVEHWFGSGINRGPAGCTPFGRPVEVIDLGRTYIPRNIRDEMLLDLAERYTAEAYSLLNNNCNNFSDELAQLLTGASVPPHITGLPATVLATPFGQMLRPMLAGLEAQMRGMRQHTIVASPEGSLQMRPDSVTAPASVTPEQVAVVADGGAAVERAADGDTALERAAPAVAAAEVELDAALAEGMMADLRAERGIQEREPGAPEPARVATEQAVQREYERLVADGVEAKQAEVQAVEQVAAARRAAEAAEQRQGASM